MSNEIHVNDIGTQLVVTVYDNNSIVDISAAAQLFIFLKKPNGTTYTKTASLYTDGTDGKMSYVATAGDFDVSGNYKIQGKVVLSGGTYYTSTATFKVHCNL